MNPPPPPVVWWVIWGAIIAAFFVIFGAFEAAGQEVAVPPVAALLALAPFAASAVLRFLWLPRAARAKKFPLFVTGLALAEAGGFLALLAGPPWKTPLAAAAIVMMIIHIPAFIRRD